jgi:hypothetical protein
MCRHLESNQKINFFFQNITIRYSIPKMFKTVAVIVVNIFLISILTNEVSSAETTDNGK